MAVRSLGVAVLVVLAACASSTIGQPTEVAGAVDLTLDSVTIGDDVATFAPAGWPIAADGTAVPLPDSGFKVGTEWHIDDRCPCSVRDAAEWEVVVAAADFDRLLDDSSVTVTRDDVGVNRRALEVSGTDGITRIVIARWVDGASAYLRCALVGETAKISDLAAALEFACDNTRAELDGR